MPTQDPLGEFLAQRVLAIVGASRDPGKWGNTVYRDLKAKGYKVYAVNKNAEEVDGDQAYHTLRDLPLKPDGVVIVTPPNVTEQIVKEVTDLGITRVWMQQGAESQVAIGHCQRHGVAVVHGVCVMVMSH